jgi:valyl-tRNA synthetase
VEFLPVRQWFINILDHKQELLEAGEKVSWYPASMKARYRAWVENLNWDWCLSRQRYFGVPIPVWHCQSCGEVILPEDGDLPVDPLEQGPGKTCPRCGGDSFSPERDLLDTWATSSMTPQIVGRWLASRDGGDGLYAQVFPFSLRPQAHDIIRTWAF